MNDLPLLLEQTSRTFALAIPLLPPPTRHEVTVAYLLFRTADTFEDAAEWTRERRLTALSDLSRALASPARIDPDELARSWSAPPAVSHAGYAALLAAFPGLLTAYLDLAPAARVIVGGHAARTIAGMTGWVSGGRPVATLDDLRGYCYAVAGIVGEMLTELFLLAQPRLASVASDLRDRAARFGEGLQLVNVLKDAAADAADGRCFLPPGVPLADVRALARRDLDAAREYAERLREGGASAGVIEFTALPVALADATLTELEWRGSGAKVSRAEVARLGRHVRQTVAAGAPLWPLTGGNR